MASTKDYLLYVLDSLSLIDGIKYKKMMGEYLLYLDQVLFGGIYDDRLLVKIVDTNKKFNLEEDIPYMGAKPMYLVDVDNKELLKDIVLNTYEGLLKNI